jgi:glycosyltransferase involved in cell wall biosynthesis
MKVSLFFHFLGLPSYVARKAWRLGRLVLPGTSEKAKHRILRTLSIVQDVRDGRRAREECRRQQEVQAKSFLASSKTLELPKSGQPTLSVALNLSGESGVDLTTLSSLIALGREFAGEERLEVFLIGSLPASCLDRVRGATAILEARPGAYLQFAAGAQGDCLLFLGAGTRLLDSSFDQAEPLAESSGSTGVRAALHRLRSSRGSGAVTGRLLGLNGRLLSAGLVLRSCNGHGAAPYAQGMAATAPEVMFERETDGGDADALLVPRSQFLALGGFGPTDNASAAGIERGSEWGERVRRDGGRVIYMPSLLAQSGLEKKKTSVGWGRTRVRYLASRDRREVLARVLLVEDQVPYPWLGAGYPRSAELLASLVEADCEVTLYPAINKEGAWGEVRSVVDARVEVMLGHNWMDFPRFWRERAGFFDLCIVCRPHNMARLRRHLFARADRPPVVYDAEALYCLRELELRRHLRIASPGGFALQQIAAEVQLAQGSTAVLSVSERELGRFRDFLETKKSDQGQAPRFYILRHTVPTTPTPASFDERDGYLFVGTLSYAHSPNADSVDWFLREIFPLLRQSTARAGQAPPSFRVVGTNSAGLEFPSHAGVEMLGRVLDLDAVYNQARVFVAPTRFAAGVPLKVYEAAGRGVPTVLTPLLVEQLNWRAGLDCLEAGDATTFAAACQRLHDDRDLWRDIRANALRRVEAECSSMDFRATVEKIVTENMRRRVRVHDGR